MCQEQFPATACRRLWRVLALAEGGLRGVEAENGRLRETRSAVDFLGADALQLKLVEMQLAMGTWVGESGALRGHGRGRFGSRVPRRPRRGGRQRANALIETRLRLSEIGRSGTMSIGRYFTEMLDPSMSWDDVAEMVRFWNGPFCLKGVMSAADARRAPRQRLKATRNPNA